MNISFFGHADFLENAFIEKKIYTLIETLAEGKDAFFLIGEHGGFDRFAYNVCDQYRKKHATAKIGGVIPYAWYGDRAAAQGVFDQIIYPP